MQEDNGDSELMNLIEIGIAASWGKHNWVPDMDHISRNWAPGVIEQTRIGWQHIFHGRISKKLIMAMDSHYLDLGITGYKYTGERWARTLIRHVWDTMLKLWRERNNLLNERDKSKAQAQLVEQMEKRVRRCYELSGHLSHRERAHWFSATMTELLQKELRHIKTWVNMVERLIRITKREQKRRPKGSIIMDRFLRLTTTKTTQRQPQQQQHPKKFRHQLKPD
jgi:hypothetical protein